MVHEERIKEEIENEKRIAEEKRKNDNGQVGGGRVQFSPQVKSRKELKKSSKMEQYSPAQRSNRNKSNSPAKSINPVTYNLKPQNEQIW